ncbi:unnamed protein product [Choristocarpus tenellus]
MSEVRWEDRARFNRRRRRPRPDFIRAPALMLFAVVSKCSASSSGSDMGSWSFNYCPPGLAQREVVPAQLEEQGYEEIHPGMGTGSSTSPYLALGPAPDPQQAQAIPPSLQSLQEKLESRDRSELAKYVGGILQKLANTNQLFHGGKPKKDSPFHSASMPSVSVADYVERVAKHVSCPNICLILTLVYLDRLALPSSELHIYVTPLTAHRLFIASLLIAEKFIEVTGLKSNDDTGSVGVSSQYDNKFYQHISSVTGLSVGELKHLEHDMLQALSKEASVTYEEAVCYMGGFLTESHKIVPFVDRPFTGHTLSAFQ